MTLTEFLLARIAEDEATATNWLRFEIRAGIAGIYTIPERVRAECEAKRRIIGRHTTCNETSFGDPCDDMLALALPYATHPDYDAAWRRDA